ncbi:metal dependent phosphohydrolase [Desulfovibrio sp. X2]|uniref:HD-GYP domain-containing protein n=1 Tax=Desulfovibrio sp. X2 TaxID=941449 RepID=UPI0003589CF5|nr:HD-GYP domain-containing protein [Desulfovibrio sp. X2]EPR39803.1 metal dependent phosphohydrolase [Desulfovibrio sp. X2]
MATFSIPEYRVHVDQLQPGVFIKLDGAWFNHPFLFNKFKIKSQEQINTLRDSGVTEVICVPAKSDKLPRPMPADAQPKAEAVVKKKPDAATERMWQVKKERIEKLKQKREEIKRCEEKYAKSIAAVPGMLTGVMTGSGEAVQNAQALVSDMADVFLSERDAIVHLMDTKATDEGLYYHSLNVSVLCLMIGKACGLPAEELKAVGVGAMFHDVGKNRIEKKILRNPHPTKAELQLIHMHPKYGLELAAKAGGFTDPSLAVIFQHHERLDGTGYPSRLSGTKIHVGARIAAIADIYDNLVNNPDQQKAVTPHQAMSFMFAKLKTKLDMQIFANFIRCLGIYPPGTLVQLSNEVLGMVIAVNQKNPLKPSLLIYDPEIPKEEAIIFDMEEDPDLQVVKSIHPGQLPPEIFAYLNPRSKVTYYMDHANEDSAK